MDSKAPEAARFLQFDPTAIASLPDSPSTSPEGHDAVRFAQFDATLFAQDIPKQTDISPATTTQIPNKDAWTSIDEADEQAELQKMQSHKEKPTVPIDLTPEDITLLLESLKGKPGVDTLRTKLEKSLPQERAIIKPLDHQTNEPISTEDRKTSITQKAQEVIRNRSFIIPQFFHDPDSSVKLQQAPEHILNNWPMEKAATILSEIEEAQLIPFQTFTFKSAQTPEGNFSVSHIQDHGSTIIQPSSGLTNLFYDQGVSIGDIYYSQDPEANFQKIYQEEGLRKMYLREISRLLQKERKNVELLQRDVANEVVVVDIPQSQYVLVAAGLNDYASSRLGAYGVILLRTSHTKETANFISTFGAQGLNALFSLMFSESLTPTIDNRLRTSLFFARGTTGATYSTRAQLVSHELKGQANQTVGVVRRLKPLE